MLQVGSDFYEDIDGPLTEKLIEAFRRGQPLKAGSQTGRFSSEPAGGINTLTDRSIYARIASSAPHTRDPALTDIDAKKPTAAAGDREAPVQKSPGAAT
jgi:NADH-quinone oxidoreductase subunit E